MFNLYNIGERRKCWIVDSVLYVQHLYSEETTTFELGASKFLKEHPHIEDFYSPMPTSRNTLFMIEDEDHNLIIGHHDCSVTISNDGWLIGCTNWNRGKLDFPHKVVGYHREYKKISEVYLDPFDNQTLLPFDCKNYARLINPLDKDFVMDEDILTFSLANVTACADTVSDSYFVLGGAENDYVTERRVAVVPGHRTSSVRVRLQ